jgi:ABC-type amino acid transport system permease subunit
MNDNNAWFVRRRSRFSFRISPYRWQGWAVTLLFAGLLVTAGLVIGPGEAIVHLVVATVLIFTFVVIAWRMSVPID